MLTACNPLTENKQWLLNLTLKTIEQMAGALKRWQRLQKQLMQSFIDTHEAEMKTILLPQAWKAEAKQAQWAH